ncbi:MAG: chemotaxis protein CheV [Thalassolituus sp.]|jgi:two-component system chemotaxis response regulator CheV|uniref:Chemotaxis protein n=2 Tax=root TaxID=1 RepID=M5E6A6_9GAMM|nr:chemotaxis protein CheV [Thalassolituus oleivorans]AHK15266.1 chemotaxis protein CheW [Thalassolituus oleivorans R6-15]MBQ0727024.1 chemotaxis protein CheV [Thalassolituus oleivorans]MBQ0782163.1 chemotaxis protein CheV [Thalassolituus oleivorans]MCA6129150.1 chemotaxis protein CheW [Thalassolituus oleivorans 4BN06-13]MDF1640018.1 chemotaxis protein CheV [Thalassolituus oleivorans]|tara:strand:+ start:795 stop:1724 length:930 start_codon:yes stop_codon:yes gene_type:complete
MAGVLESVNQRTKLVGENRLELLLFRVSGRQIYGINVFKVKEVLQCPKLTVLPGSNPVVRGVAHIRSGTIPIMDMSLATGNAPLQDIQNAFVIITEYNGKTQGFLVAGVERIINMNWESIHPPPKGTGREHYLTAVTEVDKVLVEIIDVEKILAEVSPVNETIRDGIIDDGVKSRASARKVLIVDDSKIARKQVSRCLENIGVEVVALNDGRQAWEHVQAIADSGERLQDHYMMLISDIEMPEMDGYTLTTRIRSDSRMAGFYIVLHSSLSGVFNKAMVEKVGADDFIAKFDPDILAEQVVRQVNAGSQ